MRTESLVTITRPLKFGNNTHPLFDGKYFPQHKMNLMTKDLECRFKEVGSQENIPDPVVIAKYFDPCGAGTWYAIEYNPIERIFFGYVSIFGDWND